MKITIGICIKANAFSHPCQNIVAPLARALFIIVFIVFLTYWPSLYELIKKLNNNIQLKQSLALYR